MTVYTLISTVDFHIIGVDVFVKKEEANRILNLRAQDIYSPIEGQENTSIEVHEDYANVVNDDKIYGFQIRKTNFKNACENYEEALNYIISNGLGLIAIEDIVTKQKELFNKLFKKNAEQKAVIRAIYKINNNKKHPDEAIRRLCEDD